MGRSPGLPHMLLTPFACGNRGETTHDPACSCYVLLLIANFSTAPATGPQPQQSFRRAIRVT